MAVARSAYIEDRRWKMEAKEEERREHKKKGEKV
jgi:hypothetical protein